MSDSIVPRPETHGKPIGASSPRPDVTEIERALRLLFQPGDVLEIRALDVSEPSYRAPHTVSGYYDADHLPDAAREGARLSPLAKGVYFTANPCDPALLGRAANRVRSCGRGDPATADHEILARRWLLIDLDPVRPAGIASSDAEHDAAIDLARRVRDALRQRGWPEPVFADSGNGAHLLFRIDLPRDDGGLVERCLKALAIEFGADGVKVDTSVHNPARIWKVYGTLARKGDSTHDRPHRLARILEAPAKLVVVPLELLDALASTSKDASAASRGDAPEQRFDLDRWLAAHCGKYAPRGPEPWQGGHRWVLQICPFNPDHTNAAAYIIRLSSGAIAFGCHHAGCRDRDWHALRALVEPAHQETKSGGRPNKAAKLLKLVEASRAELFHTSNDRAYGTVRGSRGVETFPLRSMQARRWLRQLGWHGGVGSVSNQVVEDAIATLDARASFDSPEKPIHIRIGEHEGQIFIDLANETGEAVEIGPDGYKIIRGAPIRFVRPAGTLPLPRPAPGGALADLRKYVHVSDDGWPLVLGWLVAAVRPTTVFPVLHLFGEAGTAKSTGCECLSKLIDPRKAGVRRLPRDARDLAISLEKTRCLAFDNLSFLSDEMSDAICCASTGHGFATRQLYSDDEEHLFESSRPIILAGIAEIARRSDLLDRCLMVECLPIGDETRRTPEEIWRAFEQDHPQILGSLYQAVATALRRVPDVKLDRLPRMAGFATWAVAAEPALDLAAGEFLKAYTRTRRASDALLIEASPLAAELDTFMRHRREWSGTADALLKALEESYDENALKKLRARGFPSRPDRLGVALRRLGPILRRGGLEVVHRRNGRFRIIELRRTDDGDASDHADDADREKPSPRKSAPGAGGGSGDADDASLPSRPQDDGRELF